jgi:hypothetical protein
MAFEEHNLIAAAILLPFWTMLYSAWKGYTLQAFVRFVFWLIAFICGATKKSSY